VGRLQVACSIRAREGGLHVSRIASTRRRRAGVALVVAGVLLAAGCTHGPGRPPRTTRTTATTVPARPVLDGTSWELVPSSLGVPVPAGIAVTASFAAGRVTGSAGCNLYFGDVGVEPSSTFRVSNVGSTDRACESAVGEVESAYLERLSAATTYVLVGDDLRLSGPAGALWFRRAGAGPTSSALVGDWTVTGFLHRTTQVIGPARSGTTVELGIDADGTLWAAVCFSHQANWSVTGDRIVISDFWGVDTVCSGPNGQFEDEGDVFAALRDARRWRVDGDTVTLLSGSGAVLLTATRVPA
jgi:heat shock protein HslJ